MSKMSGRFTTIFALSGRVRGNQTNPFFTDFPHLPCPQQIQIVHSTKFLRRSTRTANHSRKIKHSHRKRNSIQPGQAHPCCSHTIRFHSKYLLCPIVHSRRTQRKWRLWWLIVVSFLFRREGARNESIEFGECHRFDGRKWWRNATISVEQGGPLLREADPRGFRTSLPAWHGWLWHGQSGSM